MSSNLAAIVQSAVDAANANKRSIAGFGPFGIGAFFQRAPTGDQMRALAKSLNIPLVAASQLGLESGDITARAKGVSRSLNQLTAVLQTLGPGSAANSIAALESAMSYVTKTANFLKTADLGNDDDENKLFKVLSDCEKAFEDAVVVAKAGLSHMEELHVQVVELHAQKLTPLNERVASLNQEIPDELKRVKQQYDQAKAEAASEEIVANSMAASVESLQKKIRENEQSSHDSDIAFDVLTFGIAKAANGHPPDPFNYHGQLNDAQKALDEANNNRARANNIVSVMHFQMDQFRAQLMDVEAMQGSIPKLTAHLEHIRDASAAVQSQFVDIENRASALVVQIGNVHSTAQNTRDTATVQQEVIQGLLTMCEQVLIDPKLIDEVNAVTDITDKGFKLAKLSQDTRTEIDNLVASMSQKTSIADMNAAGLVGPLGIPLSSRAQQQLAQNISPIDRLPIGPLGLPSVVRTMA